MNSRLLRYTKGARLFRRWRKATITATLAPLTDPSGRFQLASVAVILALIFFAFGSGTAGSQIYSLVTQRVLIWSMPVFVTWNAIIAVFSAVKEERNLGEWFDARFIYHSPLHVFTVLITSADNNRAIVFPIPDAEIGTLVEVIIDIDRRDERVRAQIAWPFQSEPIGGWHVIRRDTRYGIKLPKDRRVRLLTFAEENADPTTIRVRVSSFALQSS